MQVKPSLLPKFRLPRPDIVITFLPVFFLPPSWDFLCFDVEAFLKIVIDGLEIRHYFACLLFSTYISNLKNSTVVWTNDFLVFFLFLS